MFPAGQTAFAIDQVMLDRGFLELPVAPAQDGGRSFQLLMRRNVAADVKRYLSNASVNGLDTESLRIVGLFSVSSPAYLRQNRGTSNSELGLVAVTSKGFIIFASHF
jgi:hypothetical protein